MVHRHAMGKEGLALAVIASLAMTAVAFFIDAPAPLQGDTGICFPSPNGWGLSPVWGWLLNTLLLAVTAGMLYGANKEYGLVKGTDTVFVSLFLIMATSNVWVSGLFSTTAMLAIINIGCMMILYGCYRQNNVTKDIFVIGSILSVGSMFQYAFIFMTPVYLIGTIMLKCFNLKVVPAYLMGLIAPYWVVLGFGIADIDSLRIPDLQHVFDRLGSKSDMLVGMLNIGLTLTIGLLLGLSNAVKLYAGNSRRRLMVMSLNLLGAVTAVCMIFDFDNLTAYLATIYMVTAVQIGILFESSGFPGEKWWLLGLSALYAGGFVMMIL